MVTHFKYSIVHMSVPKSLTIPSRTSFPPAAVSLFSRSVNLFLFCELVRLYHFFLQSTYKGCPTIFLLLCLTSLSMALSRVIHVAAGGIISFFNVSVVHMYYVFLTHSSVNEHLGCFHVLAIVNSAGASTGVHVSFQTMFSLGCMPRRGIAGSYGSSVFSFFKEPPYYSP